MSDSRNRKRPIQVKFFVNENELATIKQRMAQFGTGNLSAYLREMALEGIYPNANQEESIEQEIPRKSYLLPQNRE